MKALLNLPPASKDVMLPILAARPWPNANSLGRTWEKIIEALAERRFALDLDPIKFNSGSSKAAAREFDLLFDQEDGFSHYYELVANLPSAVPVVRLSGGRAPALNEQMDHIGQLDRGAILRLEHDAVREPIELVRRVLEATDDVAVVIDLGWTRDLLSREAWASAIIQEVSTIQPEAELVVCGSSFPDAFSGLGPRARVGASERSVYDALVRRHNAAALIYGDWGSTRPPSVDSAPMRNVPRIDLPTDREWICFRRENEEGYPEIATRLLSDADWPAGLNIWGTYTVRCTADEVPGAIRSAGTAAAARINIHLHRQAQFGGGPLLGDEDEPFVD